MLGVKVNAVYKAGQHKRVKRYEATEEDAEREGVKVGSYLFSQAECVDYFHNKVQTGERSPQGGKRPGAGRPRLDGEDEHHEAIEARPGGVIPSDVDGLNMVEIRAFKGLEEARLLELKRKQLAGTLVDRKAVEQRVATLVQALKRSLDSLPLRLASRVSDALVLEPADRARLEELAVEEAARVAEAARSGLQGVGGD